MKIHVTRVSGSDVYGHDSGHCDTGGCAGHSYLFLCLDASTCAVGDVVDVPAIITPFTSDGAHTIGTIDGQPAQWDGNMDLAPSEWSICREDSEFGVDFAGQFAVRGGQWVEID